MRTSRPRRAAGATGTHGAVPDELIRDRQRTLLQERLLLELELAHQTQTVHHEDESWGHLLQAQEVLAELCADDPAPPTAEVPDAYGLLRRELMRAAAARDTALIRSCLDLAEPLTGGRSRVA